MSEHAKARAWRESHALTRAHLAALIGYSDRSIYWFEEGLTPPNRNAKSGNAADRAIKPWIWQRYKMACAGVHAQIESQPFKWGK